MKCKNKIIDLIPLFKQILELYFFVFIKEVINEKKR